MSMEKKMSEKEANTLVEEVLTRGVGEFADPEGKFRKKLIGKATGTYAKDVIIKFGVDVTRPDIHLGHAVVLHKLRKLQDIGCKVVFLIGDFTTLIGDPTGRSKTRPEVDGAAIEKNMKTYLEQVGKILLVDRDANGNIIDSPVFSWMRNSDWFFGVTDVSAEGASKNLLTIKDDATGQSIVVPGTSFVAKAALYEHTRMQKTLLNRPTTYGVSFVNLLALMRHISYAQLIERDMFQERIKQGEPLFLHEMLYPIIQGADSNVMADIYGSCDLEIGGTDQVFNMLMGRKVMEIAGKEPQAVLGMRLLVGLDGKEKMSKSLDNYIGVTDTPRDIFGKTMSIPDAAIVEYYELATYTPKERVAEIAKTLKGGSVNPRDLKLDLAEQLVGIFYGGESAKTTRAEFLATFQRKEVPEDIENITVKKGTLLVDALLTGKLVESKTEFRRLLESGAIRKNGEDKFQDPLQKIEENTVVKVGKHRFLRIVIG